MQELAFTFANAIEYVERAIEAGLAVDAFAPRLSFFFAAHNDLFEEVAKFRAARRIYARLMRDRFKANENSARLRFHTQTGGVTLAGAAAAEQRRARDGAGARRGAGRHAVAAHERLRRGAVASDGIRGDARASHATDHRQRIGRGVDRRSARGSYYVEHLTDELERRATGLLARVDELGGARRKQSVHPFFQEEIARSALRVPAESRERRRDRRWRQQVCRRSRVARDLRRRTIPHSNADQVERVRTVRRASVMPRALMPRSPHCARRAGHIVAADAPRTPLMEPHRRRRFAHGRASVRLPMRCAPSGERIAQRETRSRCP